MTNSLMLLCMTRPAKGDEILKRVVSLVFGGRYAIPVYVMNVQIILAVAVLACMFVALQGGFSVPAKIVIVFGCFGVFLFALRIKDKPSVNALHFSGLLARRAAVLRAGLVLKIISAVGAHQNRSDRCGPCGNTQFTQMLGVALSPVRITTDWARLLMASCGLVARPALDAAPVRKTDPCLPMRFQRARFAAFHVWRGFGRAYPAVGAIKKSVLAHGKSSVKLVRSHYTVGGK